GIKEYFWANAVIQFGESHLGGANIIRKPLQAQQAVSAASAGYLVSQVRNDRGVNGRIVEISVCNRVANDPGDGTVASIEEEGRRTIDRKGDVAVCGRVKSLGPSAVIGRKRGGAEIRNVGHSVAFGSDAAESVARTISVAKASDDEFGKIIGGASVHCRAK